MDEHKTGALRGELSVKTLILYVLRHFDALPTDMLTALTMDRVADRMEYTAALSDLESDGLCAVDGSGYRITAFGMQTLEAVEDELPAATRARTDRDIADALSELRRRDAVDATVVPDGDCWRVTLTINSDDNREVVLDMLFPTEQSANRATRAWRRYAYEVYKDLLTWLG